MKVAIQGRGVAGSCCAYLLTQAGLDVELLGQAPERSVTSVPAILLSDAALALLRDVFGRSTLFADRLRITRRVVSWGGTEPVSMPHGGVVVSGRDLNRALDTSVTGTSECSPDLSICAEPPFPAGDVRHFGARRTFATRVISLCEDDRSTIWTESVEAGWLFFIPAGWGEGWLLSVGAEPEALLKQSRYLASRIALPASSDSEPQVRSFDSHPRIMSTLQGSGWLACGTAALGFDPICGDGTAQALRESILASAAAVAIHEDEPAEAVRMHHESMLIAAMRRHLKLCGRFYQDGGEGDWWRAQFDALVDGYHWCSERLGTMPEPRYGLRGSRLVPWTMVA